METIKKVGLFCWGVIRFIPYFLLIDFIMTKVKDVGLWFNPILYSWITASSNKVIFVLFLIFAPMFILLPTIALGIGIRSVCEYIFKYIISFLPKWWRTIKVITYGYLGIKVPISLIMIWGATSNFAILWIISSSIITYLLFWCILKSIYDVINEAEELFYYQQSYNYNYSEVSQPYTGSINSEQKFDDFLNYSPLLNEKNKSTEFYDYIPDKPDENIQGDSNNPKIN